MTSIIDSGSASSSPIVDKLNDLDIDQNKHFLHINTPLIESLKLNSVINKTTTTDTTTTTTTTDTTKIWLKLDSAQPSGSFKIRGVGYHCSRVVKESGAKHLVCSSGGNAGMSVAYAARRLGVKSTIVLPVSIPEETREKIRAEGAEVIAHGKVWDEADLLAREIAKREGEHGYIHPFDHENLWIGHSTLIDEIASDVASGKVPKPDAIVCSIGGGGLIAGIVRGLQRHGWDDTTVVAVETHGARSFYESVKQGKQVRLEVEQVNSICKTLATRSVCKEAFECSLKHKVVTILVSDFEAVDACLKLVDDERVLVEPACGASVAAIYQRAPEILNLNAKNIIVIVCGGNNTSIKQLNDFYVNLNPANTNNTTSTTNN
ncbi:L-serine ammonia-lyase [Cavenderia fasciculata]|uniref:L-serine ammonia-lyase n=1 Tax=Cavenderia fasciculata TaxID=261658 RepID=F4PPV2_CACFS|nr:L-serine ammonia-lyase [Cavenderia fasciculata]EGG22415.1 L-serine ammonia-lyase [Cavenderia fasciculata]|eukprot:XP_004360266.1 L-serine ammonia-lyase [Cavenderia fasciculata]